MQGELRLQEDVARQASTVGESDLDRVPDLFDSIVIAHAGSVGRRGRGVKHGRVVTFRACSHASSPSSDCWP